MTMVERGPSWKWMVCGLLLFATMLNYMDRQTLSLTITEISAELGLNNEQYGSLEKAFGLAFATGAIVFGVLVDRLGARWLYPFVFVGWSCAGIATAYAESIGNWFYGSSSNNLTSPAYFGLMVCRTVLGFFEAGHWPCALVTTQRILSREDRPLGNSLLQSGASIGAILTPQIVLRLVSEEPGSWRIPYVVIGVVGMVWIVPWLLLIRSNELGAKSANSDGSSGNSIAPAAGQFPTRFGPFFSLRFVGLLVTVVAINLTWQYFRAWLPKFIREFHEYPREQVSHFTSAYYISTDIGCLTAGAMSKWLTSKGTPVHTARMVVFFGCSLLVGLGFVAATLSKGPLLLGILLVVGFGALGLFPIYYSLAQELWPNRQGLVSGTLGATTWVITSIMQQQFGKSIDESKSYAWGIQAISIGPIIACVVLALLWQHTGATKPQEKTPESDQLV